MGRTAMEILESLVLRAEATGGPNPDEILLAFTDAECYPEFDNDPAASYLTGFLVGYAEALEMPIEDLLHRLNRGGKDGSQG